MTVALGQPGKVEQKAVVQSAYQHLPVLTSYRVEQTTRAGGSDTSESSSSII